MFLLAYVVGLSTSGLIFVHFLNGYENIIVCDTSIRIFFLLLPIIFIVIDRYYEHGKFEYDGFNAIGGRRGIQRS